MIHFHSLLLAAVLLMNGLLPAPAALGTAEQTSGVSLAVLPFRVVTNEGGMDVQELGMRAQENCISVARAELVGVAVQDVLTTNALLAGKGIGVEEVHSTTPAELAAMLGVQHVLVGSLDLVYTGERSTGTQHSTQRGGRTDSNGRYRSSTTSTGSASTRTTYESTVAMTLYTSDGSALWSSDRKAFGSSFDAYRGTLKYLLKRCPFGKKSR